MSASDKKLEADIGVELMILIFNIYVYFISCFFEMLASFFFCINIPYTKKQSKCSKYIIICYIIPEHYKEVA